MDVHHTSVDRNKRMKTSQVSSNMDRKIHRAHPYKDCYTDTEHDVLNFLKLQDNMHSLLI